MDYNNIFKKYIYEYIELGKKAGYFNTLQSIKFRKLLESINLEINYNLEGNAHVVGNKIIINPKRIFGKDEKFASEVFFHEFSHIINNIHIDITKDDNESLLKSFKYTFIETMKYYFRKDYSNSPLNNDDISSPYEYTLYGVLLLDEAIAQNITEDLLSIKYNIPRRKKIEYSAFADIKYNTDFSIYGIYQELAEVFSKTIRGFNNLKELSIASFEPNFVNNLISEHMENHYTYEALYQKLSYLGVIYFAQEKYNGHLENKEDVITRTIANNAYNRALKICNAGIDNRPKPVYKKIIKSFNRLDTL